MMMSNLLLLVIVIAFACIFNSAFSSSAASFDQDFIVTWGEGRGKILNNGQLLDLSLDKTSGSGIESRHHYLYSRIDMNIKLVPGNSAGTVTTYYLSSQGTSHDEIDFEFLGNLTGSPYTLHTNVYTNGYGGREQQFTLWFDPTKAYHTYTIIWNPHSIYFFVDDIPIREFKNLESYGVPYPSNQPMSVYACLWDAEEWATQGGRVKTDWTQAPFTASFTDYRGDGCIKNIEDDGDTSSSCSSKPWYNKYLHEGQQSQLKWVQENYMIYNYCTDTKRFPRGIPFECTVNI